jgi:hypothetical protein
MGQNPIVALIVLVLGISYFVIFAKRKAGALQVEGSLRSKILNWITKLASLAMGIVYLYTLPQGESRNVFTLVSLTLGASINFYLAEVLSSLMYYLHVFWSDAADSYFTQDEKANEKMREYMKEYTWYMFIALVVWAFIAAVFGGGTVGFGIWALGTIFGLIISSFEDRNHVSDRMKNAVPEIYSKKPKKKEPATS